MNRPLCAHGYFLMQDSCPGCDAEKEIPHPAIPIRVKPSWAKHFHTRCQRCSQRPSHRIHVEMNP